MEEDIVSAGVVGVVVEAVDAAAVTVVAVLVLVPVPVLVLVEVEAKEDAAEGMAGVAGFMERTVEAEGGAGAGVVAEVEVEVEEWVGTLVLVLPEDFWAVLL